eukprot:PITA_18598
MHTFQLKLKEIKGKIRKWNREEFGHIMEEKQKLEKEMEDIQQQIILEGRDEERSKEEGRIINQLEERRKQEEIMWRQKSRINWLREGERNTKFFHQAMIQNRQRNQIFSIKTAEGERVVEQEGIERVLVDYHKGIFTETQEARGEAIDHICKEIPKLITTEQNKALMHAATMEEVEEVVMNMKKGKAPRPDGFTVEFYQAGWHFLGQEILEAIEESRLKQKIWPGINSTFLTLIPKSNNSEEAQGFRPIALCNVIYKIIATLIAKRLKPLLPSIISPEQTSFVEGRQILDGLVVTQEMIHSLNQKKQRGMMIKLDLSKAYDCLSWRYLRKVLEVYGFEKRWIEWIYSMISTPIFSILVNGTPTKTFNASRGIRQGDPISPFLFILAAEGLERIIKREIRKKKISGLKPWGNNLAITHQQFVDDIMLFGEVSIKEVRAIKEVLEIFMEASGMEINKEKSCTFIFNTPEAIKDHLTRTLGFRQGDLPTKYLGNQLDIHPTRMKNWPEVIDKIKRRLTSWSFRSLNIASRIVLLKSVLQSIPIYPLSTKAASKGVCTKLREIFGKFVWGGPKQQRKWALVSWKNLIQRKEEGRLADRLRIEEVPKGSSIWDLASQNKDVVNQHAFWEIRGGSNAKFWEDGWQQKGKMVEIQTLQEIQQKAKRAGMEYVRDYWTNEESSGIWRTWRKPEEWCENINSELEKNYLKEVDLRKIKIKTGEDILRWGRSMKGTFTVKEAYYLKTKQDREEGDIDWRTISEGKWWLKITIFVWLVSKGRILTWDKILKRGYYRPSICSLCSSEMENQEHLLNECPYAESVWEKIRSLFGRTMRDPRSIQNTILQWGTGQFHSKVVRSIWNLAVGFVIWFIWKERNRRIFRGQSSRPEKVWEEVSKAIKEIVLSDTWEEEDWKMDQAEGRIASKLNLEFRMIYPRKEKRGNSQAQSPNQFRYPGIHSIKLNFDGASKGNPGPAGLGGIFRDGHGKTRWVFAKWGGEMTNNEAELWAVHQGLRIAVRNRYMNLEIEGDSQITIRML